MVKICVNLWISARVALVSRFRQFWGTFGPWRFSTNLLKPVCLSFTTTTTLDHYYSWWVVITDDHGKASTFIELLIWISGDQGDQINQSGSASILNFCVVIGEPYADSGLAFDSTTNRPEKQSNGQETLISFAWCPTTLHPILQDRNIMDSTVLFLRLHYRLGFRSHNTVLDPKIPPRIGSLGKAPLLLVPPPPSRRSCKTRSTSIY